jgi:hypothetical protein
MQLPTKILFALGYLHPSYMPSPSWLHEFHKPNNMDMHVYK